MSIVTLKRKTQARYFPHSKGPNGFSLNGIQRFIGPGETSLGRSVTSTPFRGTVPKGHGGGTRCRVTGIKGRAARCDSNNEYPSHVIRSGEQVPQTLVKRSTMNYGPYLETIYMQTLRSQGCNWVKPQGLEQSDLQRKCIVKTEAAPRGAQTTADGQCPALAMGYTKAAPGPLRYDIFYMQKNVKTRICAAPSWPPRLNNSFCGSTRWKLM